MLSLMIATVVLAAPTPDKPDEKKVLALLQGDWVIEKAEYAGEEIKELKNQKVTFKEAVMSCTMNGSDRSCTIKLDVTQSPMHMDAYENKEIDSRSIFEIDGDTLRICSGETEVKSSTAGGKTVTEKKVGERPAKFDPKLGALVTLKRAKK